MVFYGTSLLSASLYSKESVSFNQQIRPILSDACFHCHGPDESSRKAKLRLDIRDEALKPAKSGSAAIVPGQPEKSELIARIYTSDVDELMPPEEAHKVLTAEQKEVFRRWIVEGAVYEEHWAYTPLRRPEVPSYPNLQHPIDAFIFEKLESKGWSFSPKAEKRTLLRRLSLDLTGLPPSEAEMESFLADESELSYEKQVDRLLASPSFGERMAVWWLDLARFADTVGFHGDQNQRIYPYRDYVIHAFNQNIGFDQFTVDQLAGDLVRHPTDEQWAASGFNRLNMMTREGGAQPKEYLIKYAAERVRTVGGAWLGSTLGCSECHDHKFDPFKAKDFYSMAAFFSDMEQWGVYGDYAYTPNPELRGVNNDYPFYPEKAVKNDFAERLHLKAERVMREVVQNYASQQTDQLLAQKARLSSFASKYPDGWKPMQVTLKGKGLSDKFVTKVQFLEGGVKEGANLVYKHEGEEESVAAFRVALEAWRGRYLREGRAYPPRQQWSFHLKRKGGKAEKIEMAISQAEVELPFFQNGDQVFGVHDRWLLPEFAKSQQRIYAVMVPKNVMRLEAGDELTLKLNSREVYQLEWAYSSLVPLDLKDSNDFGVDLKNVKNGILDQKDHGQRLELLSDESPEGAVFRETYLNAWVKKLKAREGKAYTMVTQSKAQPLEVRVLPRGNWMDESGPVVAPYPPEFLVSSRDAVSKERWSRLDLAHWLTSEENPLTSRTTVNRWWKLFYGQGLSSIVDDLGAQGEPPTHPELLDWLAFEFKSKGWNMKHMIRLLVTSQTYKQSSNLVASHLEEDPENRLLSSQNPRRLEAEFIRDHHLRVAGLLTEEIGGPSVKPYQPEGYYENLQFPDRPYVAEQDENQWRKGVYVHWQRTFLHPMLANFDAPMRDECIASRPYSNTPQQALTLLNDPSFVEAAEAMAQWVMKTNLEDSQRIESLFKRVIGRSPTPKEAESVFQLLQRLRREPEMDQVVTKVVSDREAKIWFQVSRVMLNLHEAITKY